MSTFETCIIAEWYRVQKCFQMWIRARVNKLARLRGGKNRPQTSKSISGAWIFQAVFWGGENANNDPSIVHCFVYIHVSTKNLHILDHLFTYQGRHFNTYSTYPNFFDIIFHKRIQNPIETTKKSSLTSFKNKYVPVSKSIHVVLQISNIPFLDITILVRCCHVISLYQTPDEDQDCKSTSQKPNVNFFVPNSARAPFYTDLHHVQKTFHLSSKSFSKKRQIQM